MQRFMKVVDNLSPVCQHIAQVWEGSIGLPPYYSQYEVYVHLQPRTLLHAIGLCEWFSDSSFTSFCINYDNPLPL